MEKNIELLAEFGEKYIKLELGKNLAEAELYYSLYQKTAEEPLKEKSSKSFEEVKTFYGKAYICGIDLDEYKNRIKFLEDKLK